MNADASPAAPLSAKQEPLGSADRTEARGGSFFGSKARNCWRILLLWMVISVPVVYLIYATIEPRYEAVSRIRVEPSLPNLYDPMHESLAPDSKSYEPYLQTQIALMTSDLVLNRAIAGRSVANLPMIRGSADPKADLCERLDIKIEPNTYLIAISLRSRDPSEAAEIVNAVVDTYVDVRASYDQSKDARLKSELKFQLTELDAETKKKMDELKELHQKGTLQILNQDTSGNSEDAERGLASTITSVHEQRLRQTVAAMIQVDLDLVAARAELKARIEMQKDPQDGGRQALEDDDDLEDRVAQAFFEEPDAKALSCEIREAQFERDLVAKLVKQGAGEGSAPAVEVARASRPTNQGLGGVVGCQVRCDPPAAARPRERTPGIRRNRRIAAEDQNSTRTESQLRKTA